MTTELSPEVKKEIEVAKTETLALQVVDAETYSKAGELLVLNKDLQKEIIGFFKPLKQAADAAKKVLLDAEKAEIAKVEPNISHLNAQMTAWNIAEEKKRKAEEERLRREAERLAEEEKIAAALEAEKSGNKEEAAAILDEPVFVAPPVVAKSVPKVAGQTMVTTWKWRLSDINKVPRKYLMINEVAINAEVRNQKDATDIPGITVYPEHGMRGVRR